MRLNLDCEPRLARIVLLSGSIAVLLLLGGTHAIAEPGQGLRGGLDRISVGAKVLSTGATENDPSQRRLPLLFESNWGQADPKVVFLSRGPGYFASFEPGGLFFSFVQSTNEGTASRSDKSFQNPHNIRIPNLQLQMSFDGSRTNTSIEGVQADVLACWS
jgi:hypothetical protein